MNRCLSCYDCGFWDSEVCGCTCSDLDKWYACPLESRKPENQQALQEYSEQLMKRGDNSIEKYRR